MMEGNKDLKFTLLTPAWTVSSNEEASAFDGGLDSLATDIALMPL